MNGTDTVIIRRGENIPATDNNQIVTVVDGNGQSYVLRIYNDKSYLTEHGWTDEVNIDWNTYVAIDVARCDQSVPDGNWMILKWLKDNYAFDFSSFPIIYYTNDRDFAPYYGTITCYDNLCLVFNNDEIENLAFYDDYEIHETSGYVNCEGSGNVEPIEQIEHYVNILSLDRLDDSTETGSSYSAAMNSLILALKGLLQDVFV